MLIDENVREELQAKKLHALRRGKIITDDELAVNEDEEAEGEAGDEEAEVEASDEEAEGEAGCASRGGAATTALREVKWSLPEGLVVAEKPATLDDSLVGAIIFMR